MNLTWFQCLVRNWPGFCVGTEKYLVLVSGSKLAWFLCRGIEIDLTLDWDRIDLLSVVASKLTSFCLGIKFDLVQCWDRNWLVCWAGGRNWLCAGRNWLVFSAVIVLLGFCVDGRNCHGFCMRATNLVWASKLTWFLCGWSKLAWFQCGDRSFVNERKRSRVQIPPKSYFRFYWNASPHKSQALCKTR